MSTPEMSEAEFKQRVAEASADCPALAAILEPAPATQGETHAREQWAMWERNTKACEAEIATLRSELNAAKAERDQARQDLEERCAENDRERAAHLQAYQEACKERDAAIANHIAAQSKLTAAESELAELRKDRETLKRLRTMAKNADNISLGASIRHADAARNQQEGRG